MKHNAFLKISALLICVLLCAASFAACGSSGKYAEDMDVYHEKLDASVTKSGGDQSAPLEESKAASANDKGSAAYGRKIIEKYSYSVETKTFDELISQLMSKVSEMGGYIERSETSGNYNYREARYATYTIRVPSSVSGEFGGFISENSNVVRKTLETTDITLQYVDIESRVKSLEAEKEKLEELAAKAETVYDLLEINNKLTDVIYQIESYRSQLKVYDNLVDYTTIYLSISEVEVITPVEERTVWQEIGDNLSKGFENVAKGAERFFVFIASAIPYLLVIAAIVAVILIVCFVSRRKKGKKKSDEKPSEPTTWENK